MLQAALRAEMEYNNIRAIASEASGLGSQAFSAQVNASQAKKTISKYSDDNGSNKSGGLSKGPLPCYGCGGPHPWSLLEHGIHVINSLTPMGARERPPFKELRAHVVSPQIFVRW